jgi:hypothetical protein
MDKQVQGGVGPSILDEGARSEREIRSDQDSALATFGLYKEGNGVLSLYLSPTRPRLLTSLLYAQARNRNVVVYSPLPAPAGCRDLPAGGWIGDGEEILGLSEPVEAVVLDMLPEVEKIDRELPASLLAHPEAALPESLGAKVALCLLDPSHGVVLSRDPKILEHCMSAHLQWLLTKAGVTDVPDIGSCMEAMMVPQDSWSWWNVHFSQHRKYQTLDFTLNDDLGDQDVAPVRWVAPRTGGWWRQGWSW